jgi:hypothetical protein
MWKAVALIAATVLIATVGVTLIALRTSATKTPTATTGTSQQQTSNSSSSGAVTSAAPATSPSFDRASAGQAYLAAIGISNATTSQLNDLINTDMQKPCTCSPGEFNAIDAVHYLPTYDSQMTLAASQLTALAATLPPSIAPDIAAVAKGLSTEKALFDSFFSAMNTGQDPTTIQNQMTTLDATDHNASIKARADLGLPPP